MNSKTLLSVLTKSLTDFVLLVPGGGGVHFIPLWRVLPDGFHHVHELHFFLGHVPLHQH